MKRQEKADPSCLGSLPLTATAAYQFDKALAEHVRVHQHIHATSSPLPFSSCLVLLLFLQHTFLNEHNVCLLLQSWKHSDWLCIGFLRTDVCYLYLCVGAHVEYVLA